MENKESFPCPTILAHYLKHQMIKGVQDFSVRNITGLKFVDVNIFSPFGLICETWRKFTGSGRWSSTHFCFQQPSGNYSFAYGSVPTSIIDDFAPMPVDKDELLSPLRSLLLFGVNKKEEHLEILNRMDDFVLKVPDSLEKEPDLFSETLFRSELNWKVEADIVKDNVVSHWMSVPMKGPTEEAVRLSFYRKFPNAQILKIYATTPSAF